MSAGEIRAAVREALDLGLLSPREVLSADFYVADHSARVGCLELVAAGGKGLVVKRGFDRKSRAIVRREGLVLARLSRRARARALLRALPAVKRVDRRTGTVIMERVRGPGPLDRQVASGADPGRACLRDAGRALAHLHALRPVRTFSGRRTAARPSLPWQLRLSEPPSLDLLRSASPAWIEFIEIVQNHPAFFEPIREAAADWDDGALIHGDLRWENCLVERKGNASRIRIIDWESAGPGDPAWDLGAFLGESARVAVFGELVAGSAAAAGGPSTAHTAVAPVAPFWEGYRRTSARERRRHAPGLLIRAVRYSAVWLLGRVFELSMTMVTLDASCRHALDLAARVLAEPKAASRRFYRCPPDAEPA